jgi:hypothetical protein
MAVIGPPAYEFLVQKLHDPELPMRVRRQLPRAIARFAPQEAASILLPHLLVENDGVTRYKTIRALGRLRTDYPAIQLDVAQLDRAIETNLRQASRTYDWNARLTVFIDSRSDVPDALALLRELCVEKHQNALERIFRLLQLKHPREDLQRMYRGLESGNPRDRASVRELLEHVLRPPVRETLIAMIDDVPRRAVSAQGGDRLEQVIDEIIREGGASLGCLACAAAGELGLVRFAPTIESMAARSTGILAKTFHRALEIMAAGAAR